jgi:hypothetical protein
LYVKMFFNRDSAIQKCSRDSTLFASQEKSVPCQLSGRRAIPFGRSSVHSSIRPDDVPYRPDTRQTKHHSSGRRGFPSRPSTVSRSFCSSLHSSVRLSSPSERRPVIDQLKIFFPSSNKGRLMMSDKYCIFGPLDLH